MVVDTQLYDLLGVTPNASQREIKRAFQKKARELHPDKNRGDPNATANFQALNEAYEILKDPNKRRQYDQFGINGTNREDGIFGSDLFNDFMNFNPFASFGFRFNRGDPFNSRVYQNNSYKTDDISITLECSLEEFYNGAFKTLQIERTRICQKCGGKGLKKGRKIQQCRTCNGTGQVTQRQQMGPNSFIKINTCPTCKGTGEFIRNDDKCSECKGKKVVAETKQFQVHISRGMENGEEIIYKGESNETPNAETGDLVVTIQEKPHDIFIRNFANLMIRKEITLSEALLGVKFPLTHLDGRILIISNDAILPNSQKKGYKSKKAKNPNLIITYVTPEVIENGSTMVVKGEGMPYKDNPFDKGDLFIYFDVKFPIYNNNFSKEFINALEKTFPKSEDKESIDLEQDEVNEVILLDSNIEEFNNSKKTYNPNRDEAYRSSDDSDNSNDFNFLFF